jgi:hypothetical protein
MFTTYSRCSRHTLAKSVRVAQHQSLTSIELKVFENIFVQPTGPIGAKLGNDGIEILLAQIGRPSRVSKRTLSTGAVAFFAFADKASANLLQESLLGASEGREGKKTRKWHEISLPATRSSELIPALPTIAWVREKPFEKKGR